MRVIYFHFLKFFAVVVTLAFARNSFWGWDIFAFLSLFTKGCWNNIPYISNMLLLRSNIQPLLRFLLCVMRSVCSRHYALSLGCFCSSSLTLLVCFWYIYFIFTYFIYLLFVIFYFGMLACFVYESNYFNSQLMACNGYWVKPVEPINPLLYVFKDNNNNTQ